MDYTVVIQVLGLLGVGSLINTFGRWWVSRRRERAEVAHTDADTLHTGMETIDMSLQMYAKLLKEHKDLTEKYQNLSLRMLRIEKWAMENGLVLPNGEHSEEDV